ncbi:MAG: hypothetical protein HOG05_07620 [Bacteroidetes bacterium]|nr:hypothetical protein [Bacteroidota bacterium]MBT3933231.1 hypothetical protein [Bacteroidota bacterium]MBT4729616.1 hypothetical protein [Bacteroidota bacterium]
MRYPASLKDNAVKKYVASNEPDFSLQSKRHSSREDYFNPILAIEEI